MRMVFLMTHTTTTETLTADTITTAQIRALHGDAVAEGDHRQADLCQIATAAHETANEDGADLVGPDGEIWTRTEAREACADAINAARAMESVDAYVVWEGGIRHVETSESAARKSYEHLSRCGVPCSIYIDDTCHGSANGAGDVVDWDAVRDAASPTGQDGRR